MLHPSPTFAALAARLAAVACATPQQQAVDREMLPAASFAVLPANSAPGHTRPHADTRHRNLGSTVVPSHPVRTAFPA